MSDSSIDSSSVTQPGKYHDTGQLDSEIHIWFTRTDSMDVPGEAVLSDSELEKYRSIKHPSNARDYLVAHALLRNVLSKYAGVAVSDLQFEYSEHGKPMLVAAEGVPAIEFNLTHTSATASGQSGSGQSDSGCNDSGLCACVISTQGLCGIDVENVARQNRIDAVAKRLFAEEECRVLADSENKAAAFFRYWTLREAYLKAVGTGLSGSSKVFRFEVDAAAEAAVIHHADLPRENRRWRFQLYRLSPNYQLTVALEAADDVEVRLFEFDAADFD